MKYLMGCGHVSAAIDGNGNPICAICAGIKSGGRVPIAECEGNKGLEGRKAKCLDCGKIVESSWGLPFFRYSPNSKYDSFYDGCYGW